MECYTWGSLKQKLPPPPFSSLKYLLSKWQKSSLAMEKALSPNIQQRPGKRPPSFFFQSVPTFSGKPSPASLFQQSAAWLSFISSMASLAAGPTHGEGSPHTSRVLPAPLIYQIPLGSSKGSTSLFSKKNYDK